METAVAHHQAGRLEDAAQIYEQVLATAPDHTDALHLLGLIDAARGYNDLALERIGRAIQLQPATAVYHSNLGKLLRETDRLEQAEASYREAVRLDPGAADALVGLGMVLKALEQSDEAAVCFRRAAEANPQLLVAQMQLASAMRAAGNIEEAIACFRRAVEIKPGHARAHGNLGSALRLQGRYEEAVASCRRAIELQPDYAVAHMNLGIILLLLGDMEAGWPQYEWRLRYDREAISPSCQPLWDGSPLDGRTIMLFQEQGAGDVFHFIRYVPFLRPQGGQILMECPSGLVPILQDADLGIDRLVIRGSEMPPFDVACPLLSLPGLLGTTMQHIPADVPYLKADPALVDHWQARLQAVSGFRVGIAWQGNKNHTEDHWRSLPLARLGPLARVQGVTLISLQKGEGAEQIQTVGFPVTDWTDEMDERCGPFMDTAAIMQHLDLVVTCDSSIAHLAGALGVPVWVALPAVPDWRWFLDREDSPWYPTMRLFRQHKLGQWQELFERMADALAEKAGTEIVSLDAGSESAGEMPAQAPCDSLNVEISPGELLDKITILQIKAERIDDPAKLENVHAELETLERTRQESLQPSPKLDELIVQLKAVNENLWQVEDELRHLEREQDFGAEFVKLARRVYQHNDRRSSLKRHINTLLGSRLTEEKSYDTAGDVADAKPLASAQTNRSSTGQGRGDREAWISTGPVRLKKCRYGPTLYPVKDRYIGQSLDTYGEFSQGEMELLGQVIQPGQVVLDVGANIGTHTVFLAQTVGPAGLVYAFEPQRVLFQILCGNVALNSLTNVHARQAAVGRQSGTVPVPTRDYTTVGNFGGVSLEGCKQGEDVPLLCVDELDLHACHLIKIDVEGMESEVLAGAEQTIRRFRPLVYVENDRADKSASLIEQLFALEYRLYWHLPPLFNANNFFGEAKNLFPRIVSANMLGIHRSATQNVSLREIVSPDESWAGG